MPHYFMQLWGPIKEAHPQPFYCATLPEAYDIIVEFLAPTLDIEYDMVTLYELPEVTGRATVAWQFTGIIFEDEEVDADGEVRQDTLPGEHTTLFQQLLDDFARDNPTRHRAYLLTGSGYLLEDTDDALDDMEWDEDDAAIEGILDSIDREEGYLPYQGIRRHASAFTATFSD